MPTQVQFRRGTEAQNNAFTGAAGELSYDTENSLLRVHDGSTAGGYVLAKNASVPATSDDLTEGSTNLFSTNERIDDRVAALLAAGTGITLSYDDGAGTLTINGQSGDITGVTAGNGLTGGGDSGLVEVNVVGGTGISVNADSITVDMTDFSTDDLAEGSTRLYFTDARAQAAISGGTGVTVTSGSVAIGQAVDTTSSPTFAGATFTTDVEMQGDIVPDTDNTHSLGSTTKQWKDVYVGPGSLYVNGQQVVSDNSGTITVSADTNQNVSLQTSGSGDVELDATGTGVIAIKGPLQLEDGINITNSAGNAIAFSNPINVDSLESKTADTDLTLTGKGTGKVYVNDNLEATGNVVIGGDLTVSGTTTTVNSETISLADNIIDLNSNFTSGTPSENAGLRVLRGDSTAVQLKWVEAVDQWQFTNNGSDYAEMVGADTTQTLTSKTISGSDNTLSNIANSSLSNSEITINGVATALGGTRTLDTDDLAEGSNLFYTDARANARVGAATGANLDLSSKDTADLAEGTNLYFTDARARAAISATGDVGYNSGTGVISFNESYSTPSELLTAIKTVDGAGSGLDSALLEGNAAAFFTNATNMVSGTLPSARLPELTVADFAGAAILNSSESFASNDTSLLTASAIENRYRIDIYNTSGTLLN
jgi:hypothetical protein